MMSRKDLHKTDNISLLDLVQKESGLKPSDIYKALGWSRQKYHESRRAPMLPLKYLKAVRLASGMSSLEFYAIVEKFLSK